jgi:RNA polymerase sigma-70 factor, ECF subfamily
MVQRYSRGLLFHLHRLTGDTALSDDLHQETFRIVLEKLRGEGLDQPGSLAGFILHTGRNLFFGAYRKRVRRGEGESLDAAPVEPADPTPGPLTRILREEVVQKVRRLIGGLATERDRQLLFRFYVAEEDKERICSDLGLDGVHFNRVLFRARQRLKELLREVG